MRTRKAAHFGCSLLILLLFAQHIYAEQQPLFIEGGKFPSVLQLKRESLYKVDCETLAIQNFWVADGYFMGDIKSSSNGDFIAVMNLKIPNPQDKDKKICPLTILSRDGHVLHRTDESVETFAWSPANDAIVFAAADPTLDWYARKDGGIWVLDVRSGAQKKIMDGGRGTEVYWAQFDNSIYIDTHKDLNAHVLRYDPRTSITTESEYWAVTFSLDESYYCKNADPERGAMKSHLYLRKGNIEITDTYRFLTGLDYFWFPAWVGKDLVLLYASARDLCLFDCLTGTARYSEDRFIGTCDDGSTVVLASRVDGRLRKERVVDLHVLGDGRIEPKTEVKGQGAEAVNP